MENKLNKRKPLKVYHVYSFALLVYIGLGWILTGLENIPEGRIVFLTALGVLAGLGLTFLAIINTCEGLWKNNVRDD